jgi:hypothetical protein
MLIERRTKMEYPLLPPIDPRGPRQTSAQDPRSPQLIRYAGTQMTLITCRPQLRNVAASPVPRFRRSVEDGG